MSFINKIFGNTKEPKDEKVLPWIPLTTIEQLDLIVDKSKVKTQIIFKHSTRCGISSMVLNQFINNYNLTEKEIDLFYLDLLNFREISDEVSYKFQVLHQSPQLLVIKNGIAVAHESHGSINRIDLSKLV